MNNNSFKFFIIWINYRYVEVSIAEWLDKKQSELEKSNRLELIVRSFLRWLDKNLEDVVTEALKQVIIHYMYCI